MQIEADLHLYHDTDVGIMQMVLYPSIQVMETLMGVIRDAFTFFKCLTFGQLVVSCVGMYFGWVCFRIGELDSCICYLMYCLWSELTLNR